MEKLLKKRDWYLISAKETLRLLGTSSKGFSDFEAKGRLDIFGVNELPATKKLSALKIFLSQFKNPLIFIVLVATSLSFFIGHMADAFFILVVVVINTAVSFFQEFKAEKSLKKLSNSVEFYARVFRDGIKKEILSKELVLGDIVEIREGDKIPADGRILEAKNLKINEATLTGESLAVEKTEARLFEEKTIGDQKNMVFRGTTVEEGRGIFVVTAIGIWTEMGKISRLIKEEKETLMPLQENFLRLSKILSVLILSVIFLFIGIYWWRGENFFDVLVISIALVVSAVPEGLLPAITIVLVLGMNRLLKKKALVRKLSATEGIGSISVICMDKTGTLTKGEMRVSHILSPEEILLNDHKEEKQRKEKLYSHIKTLEIAVLVQEAFIENPQEELSKWILRGRRTDQALLMAGLEAGIDSRETEKNWSLIEKFEFNSDRKYAANIYRNEKGKIIVYFLGAPEEILSRCDFWENSERSKKKFSNSEKEKFLRQVSAWADKGLRILTCAWKECEEKEYRKWDSKKNREKDFLKEFILTGFVALKDYLRSDAAEAVAKARMAGIRPLIITGDHKNTALSILKELGINASDKEVWEGKELEKMSDAELEEKVKKAVIFARVSPEHKIRIVKALQKNKEVVAMVGDGINDAPAIKAADVGVSIGRGNDVAKETADIVLLDDSFSVIVRAIEQGRLMRENIRKIFIYLLADDFSELFLFFSALVAGFPFPLYPAQIIWINLVEDSFPDVAFTAEKDAEGIMLQSPPRPGEPILNQAHKKFMLAVFFISGIAAFVSFYLSWKLWGDWDKSRSLIFALVAIDSLVFVYIVKSLKYSIFSRKIFSNKLLNLATVVSLFFLLLGFYFPPLMEFLKVSRLGYIEWLLIFVIIVVEFIFLESFKYRFLRKEEKMTQ